jgi:hypothetical protein
VMGVGRWLEGEGFCRCRMNGESARRQEWIAGAKSVYGVGAEI